MPSLPAGRARTAGSIAATGAASDALSALASSIYSGLARTLYSTNPKEGVFSPESAVSEEIYKKVLDKLDGRINTEFMGIFPTAVAKALRNEANVTNFRSPNSSNKDFSLASRKELDAAFKEAKESYTRRFNFDARAKRGTINARYSIRKRGFMNARTYHERLTTGKRYKTIRSDVLFVETGHFANSFLAIGNLNGRMRSVTRLKLLKKASNGKLVVNVSDINAKVAQANTATNAIEKLNSGLGIGISVRNKASRQFASSLSSDIEAQVTAYTQLSAATSKATARLWNSLRHRAGKEVIPYNNQRLAQASLVEAVRRAFDYGK